MTDPTALRNASERLDTLLRDVSSTRDPQVAALAREIVELLMTLHGAAFERVLGLARDPALGGDPLVTRIADDPLIGPMLSVHGLHPHPADVRVSRTLDRLRPRIAASGCRASLVSVEHGVATVTVEGRSRLSAETAATLQQWIETALLEAAPELTGVALEDVEPRGTALPLIQITRPVTQP